MKKRVNRARGFSLMEILVVLFLVLAILLVAIPALYRMLYRYRVQTAASQISINLRFARNACLKRKVTFRAVLNQDDAVPPATPNTYQIEFDNGGVWTKVRGLDVTMPQGVIIQKCDPNVPIVFNSNGSASDNFEIDVRMKDGIEYRINLERTGFVSTKCNKNCS